MFETLRIQNFKGWKDTGLIRMAPITLFFGANSSGKSSIGHFLMMLKQTVESADRKAVFFPGGENTAVQLGTFQDIVYKHNKNNRIIFEYKWKLKKILEITDKDVCKQFKVNTINFKSEVGLNDNEDRLLTVNEFNYELFNNDKYLFSVGMNRENNNYSMIFDEYVLVRKKMRAWPLKDVVRFYGFPDEAVAYYQHADFIQELNLVHEKLFRALYYLGPLRKKAERLYAWGGNAPESVGFFGENMIAAILAARKRKRKMNLGKRQGINFIEEIVASQLKALDLIEKFKVNPISEQRQEYEVKVRSKGAQEMVDLPDVGFGISQVLPVLVQCFYAPSDSVIIMEQPEIHLHPSAQSALADVMIDVIKSRENNADRNIQLIIETHSEHFLRRLQRRIAEEKISRNNVAMYFADISQHPAALQELEIDTFGNIRNWPKDFFGDEMGDIIRQAEAALERRR